MFDYDIPLPKLRIITNPLPRTLLDQMEVGASIYVAGNARVIQCCKTAFLLHGKKTGNKYTGRTDATGIRIWRLA